MYVLFIGIIFHLVQQPTAVGFKQSKLKSKFQENHILGPLPYKWDKISNQTDYIEQKSTLLELQLEYMDLTKVPFTK